MALVQRLTERNSNVNLTPLHSNVSNPDEGTSEAQLMNENDETDVTIIDDEIKSSTLYIKLQNILIFLGIIKGKFKFAFVYKCAMRIWIVYIAFVDTVVKV